MLKVVAFFGDTTDCSNSGGKNSKEVNNAYANMNTYVGTTLIGITELDAQLT